MDMLYYAVSRRRAVLPGTAERLGGVPGMGCEFPMSPFWAEPRREVRQSRAR